MLDKYGGWPLREGVNWKSEQFNWIEVKKNMQIDGFYLESIFELGFDYDFKDDKRNVFYVNTLTSIKCRSAKTKLSQTDSVQFVECKFPCIAKATNRMDQSFTKLFCRSVL